MGYERLCVVRELIKNLSSSQPGTKLHIVSEKTHATGHGDHRSPGPARVHQFLCRQICAHELSGLNRIFKSSIVSENLRKSGVTCLSLFNIDSRNVSQQFSKRIMIKNGKRTVVIVSTFTKIDDQFPNGFFFVLYFRILKK